MCSVDKLLDDKSPKPFLKINDFRSSYFKNNNHFLSDKFVCGISWTSNKKDIGVAKSLNLIDLSPLLSIANVEFVSLQYGSTKDEIELVEKNIGRKIHTIDDLDIFNDIDGLTSLISLIVGSLLESFYCMGIYQLFLNHWRPVFWRWIV